MNTLGMIKRMELFRQEKLTASLLENTAVEIDLYRPLLFENVRKKQHSFKEYKSAWLSFVIATESCLSGEMHAEVLLSAVSQRRFQVKKKTYIILAGETIICQCCLWGDDVEAALSIQVSNHIEVNFRNTVQEAQWVHTNNGVVSNVAKGQAFMPSVQVQSVGYSFIVIFAVKFVGYQKMK